jgi:thiosulfate oxidation carrier protein SoxY/thiosulfate oxidation carrier complex protein SoxZ
MFIRRRTLLQNATVQSLLWSAGVWSRPAQAALPVFESKTLAQVVKALGAKSLAASADVRLSTLDYAENGAAVPVDIATKLPGVERIALFVEKNPTPLIAVFQISDAVDTALTVHTKMAQTSDVVAVVILSDGRAFFAKKEVKVVLGSCGTTSEISEVVDSKRPTEPTRIRAQLQGESALVRMRMAHEMESGQRKNAAGKLVPAWHIDQVTISLNGKPVLSADWGPGVSKNPYLQLTLKKAKPGDKLTVVWHDNKAVSRTDDMLLV